MKYYENATQYRSGPANEADPALPMEGDFDVSFFIPIDIFFLTKYFGIFSRKRHLFGDSRWKAILVRPAGGQLLPEAVIGLPRVVTAQVG